MSSSGVLINARSTQAATLIVSSSNVLVQQNWFDNPLGARTQIATQLGNFTARINASFNWFGASAMQAVYDLDYFAANRDKCNQQWVRVRERVFDNANRSNLAQIVYWPFACNERLWLHQASIALAPPANFDLSATNTLGGVLDLGGESRLHAQRYTVVNDILVKPGAKLVIERGTELNFLNGVGMLVLGELVVDGALASPVTFRLAQQQTQVSI